MQNLIAYLFTMTIFKTYLKSDPIPGIIPWIKATKNEWHWHILKTSIRNAGKKQTMKEKKNFISIIKQPPVTSMKQEVKKGTNVFSDMRSRCPTESELSNWNYQENDFTITRLRYMLALRVMSI